MGARHRREGRRSGGRARAATAARACAASRSRAACKNPGVKLAPAGITVRELIDEFCGGMAEGHAFHAYLPGGASGGILPASMADIPLDFGTLEQYGCFIGSAAVIVLSDQRRREGAALNLMRFFEDESCGQCTPCRVGTEKAALLMERPVWDAGLLDELTPGDARRLDLRPRPGGLNPLTSVIKYFPDEFLPEAAMRHGSFTTSDSAGSAMTPARTIDTFDRLDGAASASNARRSSRAKPSGRWRSARASQIPHLCYCAAAGLPARRQLPRLHGRDRGRARAGAVLHAQAERRHEGASRQARVRVAAQKMVIELLVADQPARETSHDPDSKFWRWADKRRASPRAAFPARSSAGRPMPAIRRWRSISMPASSAASACAPAARCRSTTSSAWPSAATTPRSCSTSTTRWATAPASPAANACRPARPAR